ncbi:MAG: hypothetical protein HZB41_10040 [Ignavibacteriae bacterium]|nr:hypothetical protein [Ignavibacteriota bacterium]
MFSKILNYGIRILIIVIGILMLSGVIFIPNSPNNAMIKVFGVIFIIFGLLRIYMYYSSSRRYPKENKDGNE